MPFKIELDTLSTWDGGVYFILPSPALEITSYEITLHVFWWNFDIKLIWYKK